MWIVAGILLLVSVLQMFGLPKFLRNQMHKAQHHVVYVHLDLMRQAVCIVHSMQGRGGLTRYVFHSQSFFE